MQLPTVDDVNATRLDRFDDQITQALTQPERIDFFRDVVSHYVSEHDVSEVDVAAALAAVMHGEQPLLLEPEAEPRQRSFEERSSHGGKADRGPRESRSGQPMAAYRIEVGKRHKVEPRQIVGALANEGGLSRGDFGYISIKPDFSVVELPADLPAGTLDRLSGTRISGKLIEIKPDNGPFRGRTGGGHGGKGGGYKGKNPRYLHLLRVESATAHPDAPKCTESAHPAQDAPTRRLWRIRMRPLDVWVRRCGSPRRRTRA